MAISNHTEVIVVTQESCRAEMQSLPKRHGLELKLDVVTSVVPPSGGGAGASGNTDAHEDPELGTADALRMVHNK